ncbi:MAG: ATP-binding protein [Rhodospirillaceae bacterium]|nr:ATP-binding protein [Rhodospirillaceae bacterium]
MSSPIPLGITEIGQHGIVRSDGALVAVLEVRPFDLDVLVESQIATAVEGLAQLLASLPSPIQIVLRNRAFDPSEYLGDVTRRWSASWDHKLDRRRRLLGLPGRETDHAKGRPTTYAQAVRAAHGKWHLRQVRCYVLVAGESRNSLGPWWLRRPRAEPRPVYPGSVEGLLQVLRDGLTRAGLESRRLRGFDLLDLVEGLFRPSPTSTNVMRHAFDTVQSSATLRYRTDTPPVTRVGFDLADPFPEWIDLQPDQVVIQGPGPNTRRLRVLALRRYPREVAAGWLRWFAALKHDLDLALFIAPVDHREVRRHLSTSERELLSEVALGEGVNPEAARASRQRLEDLEDVHEAFRARERYVRTSVVLGVAADSTDTLEQATQDVEAELAAHGMLASRVVGYQQDGLRSLLPLGEDRLGRWRGLTTGPLAAAVPFHAPGLAEPGGIFLGTTIGQGRGHAPVIIDPFGPRHENPHLAVLGQSGGGKSHCAKQIALGLWLSGASLAVLDPKDEYGSLARVCEGRVLRPAVATSHAINVWDLAGVTDARGFGRVASGVRGFWRLALSGLSDQQRTIIDNTIEPTYRRRHIEASDPSTYRRPPPTTSDFARSIADCYGDDAMYRQAARDLAERLRRFTSGQLATFFDRPTNVDLDNDCTVFALRDPGADQVDILPLVYYVILVHLRNWMDGEPRKRVIVVDEAWTLLRSDQGADFLLELAKTARALQTMLLLVSQDVSELIEHAKSRAVLANCAATLLFRQHPAHERALRDAFALNHQDLTTLEQARRGQGLAIIGAGERVALETPTVRLDTGRRRRRVEPSVDTDG